MTELTTLAPGDVSPKQAHLIEQEVEAALLRHPDVTDCAVVFQGVTPEARPRHCTRCGITEKYPGIGFDPAGVCTLCTMYAEHHDDVHAYFGHVDQMVQRIRERAAGLDTDYDCLLLFSGGKDSTYVLHQLVDLGLRVMTFTFDNGFISKTALRNVEEITSELGIEHVTATRADQNKIFLLSLQQHKSVCNGCFRSLLDLSTELAHERGIPSIVTGLSRGQIIDERLSWFYHQGIFDPAEIEPKLTIGRRVYHQSGGNIDVAAVDAVEVIDYYRYSEVTKDEIRDFLQRRSRFWSEPKDTGFCSSNCMINDVGVYVHSEERGYHNYEAPTRWEVRLGHLELAEANAELQPPVANARVKTMLAKIGYADPADRARLGKRLTAYYVSPAGAEQEALRAHVARAIPDFLVPEHWVPLAEVPRDGGAVVREALAPPRPTRFGDAHGHAAPPAVAAGDGTRPVTAAQQAYLAAGTAGARALVVELAGSPDTAAIKKATLELLLQQAALRVRFVSRDGQWRQRDGGVGGAVPVASLDLSRRDPGLEPALLVAAADRLRTRLSLTDGPLLQVAVVNRGERPGRLLLVLHELLADPGTWPALLAGIEAAYREAGGGTPTELPVPAAAPSAPSEPPAAAVGGEGR